MPEEMQVTTPTTESNSTSDDFSIDEVGESASSESTDASTDTSTDASTETSETPVTEDHTETAEESTDASPFMTIKYNGAEERLSREEAVTLAQKGRNYDKIQQKLQELQNNPTMKVFEAQAKRAGITLEEYADRLTQFQEQSSINEIAQQFMQDNPDVSEEAAEAYAKQVVENQKLMNMQNEQIQIANSQKSREEEIQSELDSFQKAFPDVKIDESFPAEVIDDVRNGTRLIQAYLAYQNRQMKEQLAALQTNKKNARKSIGSVSDNQGDVKGDMFLEGLMSKD